MPRYAAEVAYLGAPFAGFQAQPNRPSVQGVLEAALEALVGRLVCLKDHYGNMAIGSLPSLESNCDEFMRRYSFTISHTNREEAITLDP